MQTSVETSRLLKVCELLQLYHNHTTVHPYGCLMHSVQFDCRSYFCKRVKDVTFIGCMSELITCWDKSSVRGCSEMYISCCLSLSVSIGQTVWCREGWMK